MVSLGHNGFGNVFHQMHLGGIGSGTGRGHQSDAMAHPEDVGIYGHGRFVEHDTLNDIGRLSSYTR